MAALDINSQYYNIFKVVEVTKIIIIDEIKLITYDLWNCAAQRLDKVHVDNVLVNFINSMIMMNVLDKTTTLLVNEHRLEETAIKRLV